MILPVSSSHILHVSENVDERCVTDLRPQLLFTAGMTLVDSVDSVLMLYSYSGFPERGFALFEKDCTPNDNLAVFDPASEPLV